MRFVNHWYRGMCVCAEKEGVVRERTQRVLTSEQEVLQQQSRCRP